MKKNLLGVVVLLSSVLSFGQSGIGDSTTIEKWSDKNLIVLLSDLDSSGLYNRAVKEVVKERWYNDKVKYVYHISKEESKAIKKRNDVMVLDVNTFLTTTSQSSPNQVICLKHFNSIAIGRLKEDNVTFYLQTNHSKNSKEWSKWVDDSTRYHSGGYHAGRIIGFGVMEKTSYERVKLSIELLFTIAEDFKGESTLIGGEDYYNTSENKLLIKEKTLLIVKSNLPRRKNDQDLLELEYVQSLYKGEVRFVSEKELGEAIKKQDSTLVYLHVTDIGRYQYCSVIDIQKRRIVYNFLEQSSFSAGYSPGVFKKMLKTLSIAIYKE